MASPARAAVVVLVTYPASSDAATLARAVVDEGLAACVNVLPQVRSFYRWDGAVQDEPEQQLVIKTHRDVVDRLEARVRELHPYDLPEFLVLAVDAGSDAYLRWIDASVRR